MNVRLSAFASLFFVVLLAGTATAQVWVDITPASGPVPTPRNLSAAIYDPSAHAMIVFGGQDSGGRLNEVWSFDLSSNSWTDLTPSTGGAPAGRITPGSVYDIHNHQLLTFSGQGAGNAFFNDTWAFDLTTHTWAEFLPPNPIPAIRYGVATCYDVLSRTQVTFAGFTNQGRFDDTWRFDPAADNWTDVSPGSGRPLERCLHAACYDAVGRRMIIYGGQNGGPLGDIWAFDLTTETWTELTPVSGPDPRFFSTFEYDALNRRATMFSGNRSSLGRANDVWVYDLWVDDWFELMPTGTKPVARDGAAAIYIESEDRLVIFGGTSDGGRLNDVWSLNNLSDTPTGIVTRGGDGSGVVLYQNYPNPFNPSSVIGFELATPANVVLAIYDVEGREVRRLANGEAGTGYHTVLWDGKNDAGIRVSSGIYVYRLQTGDVVKTRKMLLLK